MTTDDTPTPPRTPRAHPPAIQWLLVGFGVAALLGLFVVYEVAAHLLAKPPAAQAPDQPAGTFRPTREQWAALTVTAVTTHRFTTQVVADGTIAYDDDTSTPVFSPYSGRVTKLVANLGDVVKRGAPLMDVNAAEFAQGRSDLQTAYAQLALATKSEQRQHALYEAKAGALKDWLQSQADLTTARSALDAARDRLRILGVPDTQIAALESGAQKAAGHGTSIDAVATVTAPIAGTVTQRQVGLGQYIQAGASNPAYTISDLSHVWLVANARESDAPDLHVGETVAVRVLAYPGRTFSARIAWVAPALDPNTHRLPVRATMANPDGVLKPQMFASFSIAAGDPSQAPAVPRSAIVHEGEQARVYVARNDGTIALREVRLGRTDGDSVEVLAGVRAGEKVVSAGTLFIDRAVNPGS
ncbi:MAG: efflux RND transporter periplasmic adaptor subunit [Proteobacteria bacterium]|nr:efflux RND transporter periplasmic adaptor subunit [Pseudomonadota bacterium]